MTEYKKVEQQIASLAAPVDGGGAPSRSYGNSPEQVSKVHKVLAVSAVTLEPPGFTS